MPLIEESWQQEIRYFTQNEFSNKITDKDNNIINIVSVEDMNEKYDSEEFSPIDGEVIRAADQLAAYLEAWHSVKLGINSEDFSDSMKKIKELYINRTMGKLKLSELYNLL